MTRIRRCFGFIVALSTAIGVAGCGFGVDDVELNGGVFDMLGVGSNSKKVSRDDVSMKPRAPLVLPPGVERLPEPGTSMAAANPDLLTIQDPDEKPEIDQAALAKAQEEYCAKNYREYEHNSEFVKGPLGPCRKTIMSAIKKWNSEE